MLILLQLVKLMLRYMATPPALRLNDGDIATDIEAAVCLFKNWLDQSYAYSLAWKFQPGFVDCQIFKSVDGFFLIDPLFSGMTGDFF